MSQQHPSPPRGARTPSPGAASPQPGRGWPALSAPTPWPRSRALPGTGPRYKGLGSTSQPSSHSVLGTTGSRAPFPGHFGRLWDVSLGSLRGERSRIFKQHQPSWITGEELQTNEIVLAQAGSAELQRPGRRAMNPSAARLRAL